MLKPAKPFLVAEIRFPDGQVRRVETDTFVLACGVGEETEGQICGPSSFVEQVALRLYEMLLERMPEDADELSVQAGLLERAARTILF